MHKNNLKRGISLLLAIAMICSVFVTIVIPTQAAEILTGTPTGYTQAGDVVYKKSGNYVYNWGARGETATFLTTYALDFYIKYNHNYDEVSKLSGSKSESGVPSSALYDALHDIMSSAQNYQTSYEATKNLFMYTDCVNSSTTGISSFYSGVKIGPTWDGGWNREHCWPNSKGDASGNGENDIMMLRPTSSSENSSRGNKAYGKNSGYYNPNNESGGTLDLRGDVARIVLYTYVRWNCTNTGSGYNPNGIFGTNGVMESVEVLLEWIKIDPVDTWEIGRNDAVQSITGTRNVFVDYPEYAFLLFGEDIPENYISPSNGNTGGGGSGTTTTKPTQPAITEEKTEAVTEPAPDVPVKPGDAVASFALGSNGSASHSDGSEKSIYSETNNGYTLSLSGGTKMYTGAKDAKGNSCIKLGTSSATGSFTINVPNDVVSIVIHAAKYKANASVLSVNGGNHTLTKSSDNGEYDEITIDTSTTKTVTVSTTSGGKRCMINTIEFLGAKTEETEEQTTIATTETTTEAPTEAPTEKPVETTTETVTENVTEPPTEAPEENVVPGYNLVTNVSELKAGDKIVIAASGYNYALGTTQNSNNRAQAEIVKNDNTVTFGNNVQIITLEAGAISGTFAFNVGEGYLYAASSSKNYLRTQTTNNDNGLWKITINADGNATIIAQGANTNSELKYNKGSSLFSCYGSGNSQYSVSIYKLIEATPEPNPEAPKITGYNVTLNGGTTVNVQCNVSAEWLAANPDASLSFRNEFGTAPLEIVAGEHVYSITLTPQAIEKRLDFVISDGENENVTEVSYSIYAEAAKNLDGYGYEGLGDLIDAVDNYAAAANSSLDRVGYVSESFSGVEDWNPTTTGNIFKGIYANLGQQITANIKINTFVDYTGYKVTVRLGGVELVADADLTRYITAKGELVVKGLAPTHMDDTLEVVVSLNGEVVATTSFNLNSYLKSIYENDVTSDYYKNMAAVTYQYGLAAEAYARVQGK